jgi:hypothetical protein
VIPKPPKNIYIIFAEINPTFADIKPIFADIKPILLKNIKHLNNFL